MTHVHVTFELIGPESAPHRPLMCREIVCDRADCIVDKRSASILASSAPSATRNRRFPPSTVVRFDIVLDEVGADCTTVRLGGELCFTSHHKQRARGSPQLRTLSRTLWRIATLTSLSGEALR